MPDSELRQDRTTGRWVIIAPHRHERPGARAAETQGPPGPVRPRFDPACPFCPGNEAQLPGIVDQVSKQAAPGWAVRVVPNKYPALQSGANGNRQPREERMREAFGFHEVIIESPFHDADLVSIGGPELDVVATTYRDRSRLLIARPGIEAVILFRNHGPRGGASLLHPHAQVVALDVIPPHVARAADWSRSYHGTHSRCPTCDEMEYERDLGRRIVEDSPNFIVLVPFAAECPFETWIVPKGHQASFIELEDRHIHEFGALLRRTLGRLRSALDDPPYNFVIDSADRQHLGSPHVHWRLRIAPRLAMSGGFELGSAMAINPSSPEQGAAILRAARTHDVTQE
jgi:UDPglucose--hexose-1-phosphate uridylyltransferase